MTRKEAKAKLEDVAKNMLWGCGEYSEALDIAIKALEQEPCEDMERKIEKEYLFESLFEDLKKLQAENENLRKALEQEPKTGGDYISREDSLLALTGIDMDKKSAEELIALFIHRIKDLPSVNSKEPKTGRWISHIEHCNQLGLLPSGLGSYCWCSECDCGVESKHFHLVSYNYCPNCGCRMESEG